MKRKCSHCHEEFEAARTHWYCKKCTAELNATVYHATRVSYRKQNRLREKEKKAEYYQRMKQLRPPPRVYRTPRCQKIYFQEEKKEIQYTVEFL